MKLQARITALAISSGLLALACEQAPTTLDAPDISAAVKILDFNALLATSFTDDNPCTPQVEEIEFTGWEHAIMKFWDLDGSGDISVGDRAKRHFQFNLKGTDAAGLKYRLTDALNKEGLFNSMPYHETFTSRVISQTNVDNWLVRSQYTINANGDVTVDRYSEKCVG